jgi:glycosyltransferase involved in cell wall biosynthesis
LDYQPNLDALKIILYKINPILKSTQGFDYTIIICGKNLPIEMNELKDEKVNNIIYAGFVDDITIYFKGADIFINPVIDGGGIKTKLVEALGYNLSCISTVEGAIGVPQSITGNKLKIIDHKNWEAFASSTMDINPSKGMIGAAFFNHFFWDKIAEKAANVIKN